MKHEEFGTNMYRLVGFIKAANKKEYKLLFHRVPWEKRRLLVAEIYLHATASFIRQDKTPKVM